VVSIKASLAGQPGLAVGNVVGSNIFNLAVILGIAALIFPIRVKFQLLRIEVPLLIAITLLILFFFSNGVLHRWQAAILFGGILAYTVGSIILARKTASPEIAAEYEESMVGPGPQGKLWLDILLIIGGIALLIFGSRWLVDGSISIARMWGVSEAIIGLTIVAAGTSTPELAASIVAALKKEPDIAIGNIVGSNIYNSLAILGGAGLITPLPLGGVTPIDLYVMLAFSAALLPILWTGFVIQRWEGAVLLLG
jgi:cation:H+ antiporter